MADPVVSPLSEAEVEALRHEHEMHAGTIGARRAFSRLLAEASRQRAELEISQARHRDTSEKLQHAVTREMAALDQVEWQRAEIERLQGILSKLAEKD